MIIKLEKRHYIYIVASIIGILVCLLSGYMIAIGNAIGIFTFLLGMVTLGVGRSYLQGLPNSRGQVEDD